MVRHLMTYNPGSLLTVNNYFGVLQGVLHNLGIGVLPDYVTQDFPIWFRSCRISKARMFRFTSPTPKNCAIPNASRRSAILFRTRSSSSASS